MKQNRGFTLIELLVVIAIISMLTSIIIAGVGTARISARDNRRIEDIKQIQTAVEFYYDTNRVYPPTLTLLVQNNLLSVVPQDPQTHINYFYTGVQQGTVCSSFHLGAQLEGTHKALESDSDFNSQLAGVTKCEGGTGFDGNDSAKIYDIRP